MDHALVVVRAFGRYAVGDTISEEAEQRSVLGGEHAGHVVRVLHSRRED